MALNSIRVMGQAIRIMRVPTLPNNQAIGMASESEGTITLWNGMPKDIERQTLLHEAFHLIQSMCAIKSLADDEQAIATLACALLALLRDNPKLVKELTEK